MLDLIGVTEGWTCLDIGCGPAGIIPQLAKRTGQNGKIVGLDMNAGFLEHARGSFTAPNIEFVQGDAYSSGLPAATFDLVHMRFVASTSGQPERLVAEAIRLARPGGYVALQEPNGATLYCYPVKRHPELPPLRHEELPPPSGSWLRWRVVRAGDGVEGGGADR
ncbi:MAG: class I SAM-dependent methyltransferase, partial [Hyphomicrobiaceae bacterium]